MFFSPDFLLHSLSLLERRQQPDFCIGELALETYHYNFFARSHFFHTITRIQAMQAWLIISL